MVRQVPSLTVRSQKYIFGFIGVMNEMRPDWLLAECVPHSAAIANTLGGPGVPSVTIVPSTICRF